MGVPSLKTSSLPYFFLWLSPISCLPFLAAADIYGIPTLLGPGTMTGDNQKSISVLMEHT